MSERTMPAMGGCWDPWSAWVTLVAGRPLRVVVSTVGFDALLLDGQTGAYGLASPTFREVLCPPGTTMDLSEE